ncbi:MAG: hypothetical protein JO352_21235 [Chloroflexi bacterium]|nr:hypothetical protein [Chloroflexota bacterium]
MLRWLTVLLVVLMAACQSPASSSSPTPPPAVGAGRVEILNAADAALGRGDLTAASGLYERVLNTPPGGEGAPATVAINQYAHFRDLVTLLADGREDDAKAQVDALQQADASAPFARLANQLWDQYGMVGSVRGACAQVQPQIAAQAAPTLGTLQGLGVNPDPGSLCSVPAAAAGG